MRTGTAENTTPLFNFFIPVTETSNRQQLRAELRARRQRLPAGQRIVAAEQLLNTLEQLPEFLVDERIAGYWATAGELSLHSAVARLLAREQHYYLPRVSATQGELRFAPWRLGAELHSNRYGIPEPSDETLDIDPDTLDLVLLPLLAFNRSGHRLGTGGGYYDRSFAFLSQRSRPAKPLLVGIGYSFQELPAFVHEPWDIPLDFIATEQELIECSNR